MSLSPFVSFQLRFVTYLLTFPGIFPHIRRHYWGTYRNRAQVFVYPPHRMRPPAMLATTALHLSGHRGRQIACHPGTSLDVGRGENHLAPNQGCLGGWPICSHLNEVMRSWVWAAECGRKLSWSKRMVTLSIPCLLFWIARLSFISASR